jgi:Zn-dependent peptidase ImmA (M78 family)/transcriptional regulator with XRE-family HTH domain
MAFDLALFGTKVKNYREQFQLTLQEVAVGTGITEDVLTAFEGGSREPTGDEVLVLADFYKCDYNFFISNEKVTAFEATDILFRMHGTELSKDDRWSIQEFLFLCECEATVMKELEVSRPPFFFQKRGHFFKGHGEEAANALKVHLDYGEEAISFDVFADFRKAGFHVFRRLLSNSNISGLFIKHPIAGRCILINYDEDIYRQRFTAAHEAGHAIFDNDKKFVISFAWNESDLMEIRANTFASRYLLPLRSLMAIQEPDSWPKEKILEWANRLKVNTEVLAYALRDANLISNETVNVIKKVKVPQEYKIDPELENIPPRVKERRSYFLRQGLSTAYVGLCFDAYHEGHISAGRLAEMLLVTQDGLPEVAKMFGRAVDYGS